MATATLGDYVFRLDPRSVNWTLEIKSSYTDTLGGRVVQVFGVEFSDMTVEGEFGTAGWREQESFLKAAKAMGKRQFGGPMRFTVPARNWDFMVYILDYKDPQGSQSVRHTPQIYNPKWRLLLAIVEDNLDIKRVAIDAYLARISQGLGWTASRFNGPLDVQDLKNTLSQEGVSTVWDLIKKRLEQGTDSTGASSPSSPSADAGQKPTGIPTGPFQPRIIRDDARGGRINNEAAVTVDGVSMINLIKSVGVPLDENGIFAWAVSKRESGHTANVVGINGNNTWDAGLWQLNEVHWKSSMDVTQVLDPWENAKIMARISQGGSSWVPWQTSGNYSTPDGSHLRGVDMDSARKFFKDNGF